MGIVFFNENFLSIDWTKVTQARLGADTLWGFLIMDFFHQLKSFWSQ